MLDVRFEKPAGVTAAWVKRVVGGVLAAEKATFDMSVLFTDDKRIRAINKKFLKHDYATDVISFETGDLAISVDTARRFAKELGIPAKEELGRYLVHGTLHLLGYDDKKPAARRKMHERQEELLRKLI
jgi:probable rRNA maturation factor